MLTRDCPQMKVRVTVEIKEWLDKRAKEEQRSLSFLVNESLEKTKKLDEPSAEAV